LIFTGDTLCEQEKKVKIIKKMTNEGTGEWLKPALLQQK
jgi:hypothetical protein